MNRGLYIGATSLVTNQRRLDVLSNNLANINTAGYKKDISLTESFPEKLLIKMSRTPELNNVMRGNTNNITYENNGQVHSARTDNGYFVVETSRGSSYVKEIKFVVDEEGYLKTSYKDLNGQEKTDYENYITDGAGNRLTAGGDMQALLQGSVYTPPAYAIGTMSGGVRFQKIHTDFTGGNVMETGGKLDLALQGDGFFKVQSENGEVVYTRNGSFAISDGFLSDLDGRRILGRNGEIPLNGGSVEILSNGDVMVDDEYVDTLDVVDINNKEFLRKRGDNLFYMTDNSVAEEVAFGGQVLQGYLETSNMDTISGMVEMINLLREYEANQKVIKMQDEMMERAANEIARKA